MKRAALNHTKMKRLMRALNIPQYQAVGIMESLWNLTSKEAPAGNIGNKLTNEDIALQIDWRENPDELVRALLASGWLDIDEDHRLLVHDWHEHADEIVHADLARKCQRFANGTVPSSRRLNEVEREKFRKWLESEGEEPRKVGRPAKNAGEMQGKCRVNAGEMTKPLPLPKPLENTPPSRARDNEPEDPDDPPEGLARMQYAGWLLEQCNIPAVRPTMLSAEAAIGTFGRKHKYADHLAVAGLRDRAVAAQARGEPVNKFWLEDPNKWEPKANGGGNGASQSNRFKTKTERNYDAAREAIASILGGPADGVGDGKAGYGEREGLGTVRQAPVVLPPERRGASVGHDFP